MKFKIEETKKDQNFSLLYRSEEYSFDVEPFLGGGVTSILVNDLQLEIDELGRVLYVWGYCPLIIYQEIDVIPKNYKTKSLIVLLDEPPMPGISSRLNKKERWPIYINKKEGWVCLGNKEIEGQLLIEFAPDCVATVDNHELIGVWLHPQGLSF